MFGRPTPHNCTPPFQVPGVDYTFLTLEEFTKLRQSGDLLESGEYEGEMNWARHPAMHQLTSRVQCAYTEWLQVTGPEQSTVCRL